MKYTLVLLISLQWAIVPFCAAQHSEPVIGDSIEMAPYKIDFSRRKKVFTIAGLSGYTAASISLYQAWYARYESREFHFFNDWNEWHNMDKAGHVYSAYMQATLINDLSTWAGYESDKALGIAVLSSMVGQLTIEMMDGFSDGWGFSLTDLGSNLVGTGGYYVQQKLWGEQRFKMKMSYWPVSYEKRLFDSSTGMFSSLDLRADALYGKTGVERFLKDYNGQTIWVAADMKAFFPDSKWPGLLDIAVGYSAENLYGGFENKWQLDGQIYALDNDSFPRSQQWVLALDYDLSSIKAKKGFGRTLLKILDVFKFPAPGVSYDTERGWAFHLFYLN